MKLGFGGGALAVALMAAAGAATAADFGIGVKASTLGAGVELGMGLTESVNARVGLNSYSRSESRTEDGIKYDGDLDLRSTALLFDWHPFVGTFRLTAGYVFNSNKLELTGKDDGAGFDLGDVDENYALDSLTGTVDMGSGPYVGFGWGNVPAKGLGFTFDVGVFQQGSPDVTLTAAGGAGVVNDPAFIADLAEEEARLQDDLSEFEVYPVVSLGLSYGF